MRVYTKRIYDAIHDNDGFRVLVDGVWPRGMKKEDARIDLWMKSIAPSKQLRQWFGHDPAKWAAFQSAYRGELANNPAWQEFRQQIQHKSAVTILYSAKDPEHNQAVVIQNALRAN